MPIETAIVLLNAIPIIIAAAAAWYSRERARPEMQKRKLCRSLVDLRDNLRRQLRRKVSRWETSELVSAPQDLRPDERRGRSVLRVEKPGEYDEDYAALVAKIPELTDFISSTCAMQYLK